MDRKQISLRNIVNTYLEVVCRNLWDFKATPDIPDSVSVEISYAETDVTVIQAEIATGHVVLHLKQVKTAAKPADLTTG